MGFVLLSLQIYRTYHNFKIQSISVENYWLIFAAITVIVISIFIQIHAWMVIMECTHIKLAPLEAYYGYSISFLARYIPGSIWGYLSRSEWLLQNYALNFSSSNYLSFLEILLTILAGLLAIGFSLLLENNSHATVGAGFLLVLLPFLLWYPILSNSPYSMKNILASMWKMLEIKFNPSIKAWSTVLILWMVNWFLYSLSLFCLGVSLGAWNFSQLFSTWTALTAIYCVAWFIGFIIIFIPSGLGVRELALSFLLINQMHVSPGIAQGLSIFMRFSMTLAELICIAIFIVMKKNISPKSTQ